MAKILVENGERAYLGKLFGVSQPTIRRALDGKTNTDLAKKIRKVAIRHRISRGFGDCSFYSLQLAFER